MDLPRILMLVTRGAQFTCSLIVLVLGGIVPAAMIPNLPGALAVLKPYIQVPYTVWVNMTAGAFGMVSVAYLVTSNSMAKYRRNMFHVLFGVVVEFLNWALCLAALVTLCMSYVFTRDETASAVTCGNIDNFQPNNPEFEVSPTLYGTVLAYYNSLLTVCDCRIAVIEFDAVLWLVWGITLALSLLNLWNRFAESDSSTEASQAARSPPPPPTLDGTVAPTSMTQISAA